MNNFWMFPEKETIIDCGKPKLYPGIFNIIITVNNIKHPVITPEGKIEWRD